MAASPYPRDVKHIELTRGKAIACLNFGIGKFEMESRDPLSFRDDLYNFSPIEAGAVYPNSRHCGRRCRSCVVVMNSPPPGSQPLPRSYQSPPGTRLCTDHNQRSQGHRTGLSRCPICGSAIGGSDCEYWGGYSRRQQRNSWD